MEAVDVQLFFLILLGLAIIGLTIVPLFYGANEAAKSQVASTRKVYSRVAEQLGGTVSTASSRLTWAIRIPHSGVEAVVQTVSYASSNNNRDTQFQILWPEQDLRCEVQAKLWMLRLVLLLRMEDIATGDQQFDESFLVTGNNTGSIQAMLNEEARSTIQSLAKVGYDNRVYVAIQGGMFVVRKPGIIDYYGNLIRFVGLSLELYDNLVATYGIRFDDAVEELGWSSRVGHCLVCGESLASTVVYCRSCQTPHHRDCWGYSGGCATYGCQSKRASTRIRSPRLPAASPFPKRR